jgi:predicted kinase
VGGSPHDRESDIYQNVIRPREYEALMAAAIENVECGLSVIVTAPFIREFTDATWIERIRANFVSKGASTSVVWIRCDAGTMHTYIRHRGAARDAAKLADWPGYLASIDLDIRPRGPHFVVDNSVSSTPLQDQARDLLKAILAGEEGA